MKTILIYGCKDVIINVICIKSYTIINTIHFFCYLIYCFMSNRVPQLTLRTLAAQGDRKGSNQPFPRDSSRPMSIDSHMPSEVSACVSRAGMQHYSPATFLQLHHLLILVLSLVVLCSGLVFFSRLIFLALYRFAVVSCYLLV